MKTCQTCGNSFESKRKDKKYCSNSCRTTAHRQRHDLPVPSFLAEHTAKKPVKDVLSGLESDLVPKKAEHKVINPKWLEAQQNAKKWASQIELLTAQRKHFIGQYNSTLNNAPEIANAILGAGIGATAAYLLNSTNKETAKKKRKTRNKSEASNVLAGGAIGALLGILFTNQNEEQKKKIEKLLSIQKTIEQIDAEIWGLEMMISFATHGVEKEIKKTVTEYELVKSPKKQLQKIVAISEENKPLNSRIISAKELSNKDFNTWKFKNEWSDFLGEPEFGFTTLIYGKPGAGKSSFALKLSHYLANNHGKTLYISSEEGISKSIKDKINLYGATSEYLSITECKSFEEMLNTLSTFSAPFVIIDSVNHMRITPAEIEEIRKKYPKTSFILINQTTKAGLIKGSQEFAHNVDVVIRVEEKTAWTEKNRFGASTSMEIKSPVPSLELFINKDSQMNSSKEGKALQVP